MKTVQAHRYRTNHFIDWCDLNGIDNMNDLTGRSIQQALLIEVNRRMFVVAWRIYWAYINISIELLVKLQQLNQLFVSCTVFLTGVEYVSKLVDPSVTYI